MAKQLMGSLCPNCKQYPVSGALRDRFTITKTELNIFCKNCGCNLHVKLRMVPQTTITVIEDK